MSTALIIVLGLVSISVIAVIGDVISKITQAKLKAQESQGSLPQGEVKALEQRVALLEARIEERDDSVRKLQDEVRFVSRMLEDKSPGRTGT